MWQTGLISICLLPLAATMVARAGERPIVIAHRGASGYLPEHTLAAKSMAYAMGADYLEQDCVLSKDGHAMVLHDIHLDTVTDVAQKFPDLARDDGRYYALDLTLAQIKTLRVNERIHRKTGKPVFPKRFPNDTLADSLTVPTLAEEIELVQGLNKSTGRNVGIYTEIKAPQWHHEQGHDLTKVVIDTLNKYGYTKRSDMVFVQCFDETETRRVREELKSDLKLIQLLSDPVNAKQMESFAEFADGVGPSIDLLVVDSKSNSPAVSDFVETAHRFKLQVHPWTLRSDSLPPYAKSIDDLMTLVFVTAGADGAFSDFPDTSVKFVNRMDR
ncbi:UNVERIFIED_CONTAM: hypothetical protein GTU68_061878 [Idotea baltica]|nr:hypothetical protein [Idotea baltica]